MLEASLDAMINAMLPVRSPIVFVITKWNLLDHLHPDENERLRMVRERLMDTPGSPTWSRSTAPGGSCADPVTAVGHDFAEYRDGAVRKNPAAGSCRSNVEAALSVVVPDILRQTEMSLATRRRAELLARGAAAGADGPGEALRDARARTSRGRPRGFLLSSVGAGLVAESGLSLAARHARPRGYDPAEHSARLARLGEADRRAEESSRPGDGLRRAATAGRGARGEAARLPPRRDRWGDW